MVPLPPIVSSIPSSPLITSLNHRLLLLLRPSRFHCFYFVCVRVFFFYQFITSSSLLHNQKQTTTTPIRFRTHKDKISPQIQIYNKKIKIKLHYFTFNATNSHDSSLFQFDSQQ
ncbi:hypothetical protein Scep_016927 [Stephania cephalantha]|uniref:Uncharacterized protein n=1 Tax=Stephania cephalantha TaxID=152367 RepID=A0AAP0INM1_9MAGN